MYPQFDVAQLDHFRQLQELEAAFMQSVLAQLYVKLVQTTSGESSRDRLGSYQGFDPVYHYSYQEVKNIPTSFLKQKNHYTITPSHLLLLLRAIASEVLACLGTVHYQSAFACDSAPKGMEERWAKEYHKGEGGASLKTIVKCFDSILYAWKLIPDHMPLNASGFNAQEIYNAYDEACVSPRAILRRCGEGLRQKGTQYWIGKQFNGLFVVHQRAFDAVAPSIVAEIKVLGEEKHKKAQEWTDRTKEKFEDAIKAARGK
ncbi:hypothetical protein Q7P35_010514 [Cladosporium inversicolor]